MAIKGKKKSRGAQGVRRPAAAPPPPVTARRRHTPFYRTRDGMILLGILGVVAIGTVIWLVMSAQNEAKELEAKQAVLDQYGDQVEPTLQTASATALEMAAVTAVPEDPADLAEDSEGWIKNLQGAQTQFAQIFPAPEVEPVNQLFNESLALYVASAETFALVPKAEGKLQADLFIRATVQRDTAAAVWASAIGALDELRDVRDLGPSGLDAPEGPAPDPLATDPATEVIVPPEGEEEPHVDEEPHEDEAGEKEIEGDGKKSGDGKAGGNKGDKGDG